MSKVDDPEEPTIVPTSKAEAEILQLGKNWSAWK
jgi:hypothetical protein